MADYRQERKRSETIGKVTGISVTVAAHVLLALFGVFSGMTYLYPPPEEKAVLIDFTEDPEEIRQVFNGTRPQAEEIDPTQDPELVQRSEGQVKGTKPNVSAEATMDNFGDVEQYEPPREKPIDKRALFHAPDNGSDEDALSPHTATDPGNELKAGQAQGNTTTGKTDGKPNAQLKGRSVLGTLPSPSYGVQAEGKVVVKIWVDQYGTVQRAIIGDGTTATDKNLLNAALNAAKESVFNQKTDAPVLQEGTITYIFKLRQ